MLEQMLLLTNTSFLKVSKWVIHGIFQRDQSPCLQDFLRFRPLIRLSFSSGISCLQMSQKNQFVKYLPVVKVSVLMAILPYLKPAIL